VLLVLFGGGVLLCCGVFAWVGYSFAPKIVTTPDEVNKFRDEIATMTLPADLKPKTAMKMDNFAFNMIMATYSSDDNKQNFLLGSMQVKVGDAAAADQEFQMREAMGENDQQRTLKNKQSTTKKLKVKGVEREFDFATGEDVQTGKKMREVSGTFPGKSGQAFFAYQSEEDVYKEDEIIKMIESIQ
jgi:hypothetical protein